MEILSTPMTCRAYFCSALPLGGKFCKFRLEKDNLCRNSWHNKAFGWIEYQFRVRQKTVLVCNRWASSSLCISLCSVQQVNMLLLGRTCCFSSAPSPKPLVISHIRCSWSCSATMTCASHISRFP